MKNATRRAMRGAGWNAKGAALVLSALVAGCVADASSSSIGTSGATYVGGGTAGSGSGAAPNPVPPMVVDVDPGGTLVATPGEGVGVFTEYQTGGHWQIGWTCDTLVTSQSCEFQIAVTAVQGILSNFQGASLENGDELLQQRPNEILAWTRTTTGRDEIDFDATAGASIELTVTLNPAPDKTFVFFVQNGQVNGGYQGTLTNPLILEPSSP